MVIYSLENNFVKHFEGTWNFQIDARPPRIVIIWKRNFTILRRICNLPENLFFQ